MPNSPRPMDEDNLVAYLDGELEAEAVADLDQQLARNPTLRKQVEQYRKTFDMLDHLPMPEPSPNFASRTLTQLQPNLSQQQSGGKPSPSWSKYVSIIGILLLSLALGAAIPLGMGLMEARKIDDTLDDTAIVEALPIYYAVDHLEFARALHAANLFGEDHRHLPELPRYNSQELDQLVSIFRSLSGQRQQQLRQLHADLLAVPSIERMELQQTMEHYSAWLDRLPDGSRKRVLEAAPDKRLEAITDSLARQYQDWLPEQKKSGFRQLAVSERLEFLQIYFDTERNRQQDWQLAKQQWHEMKDMGDAPPWPFNDEKLSRELDDYIRIVLGVDPNKPMSSSEKKIDLPAECRLSREEILDLRRRREDAIKGQYWLTYGQLLLRLSRDHASLPRPKTGEPIVRPSQIRTLLIREAALSKAAIGKWPEFALDVARKNRLEPKQSELLGPARPEDFPDRQREVLQTQLLPKLQVEEKKKLDHLLGRWPAYPEEMMRLAQQYQICIPDVSLPGDPAKWKKYYELPSTR